MDYLIIALVTLGGAALTLFSGFGLGTLLLPVFALFFPVELAIAMTAMVHFANNLIKLSFFYKKVDWKIALRFGIPSVVAAFAGAWLLTLLTELPQVATYTLGDKEFAITPLKLCVAFLLALFSAMELLPRLSGLQFDVRWLTLGGLLSGFFGGLSGHQGALRSAFLIRSGLNKEAFIATGVIIACMVDITRLSIYSGSMMHRIDQRSAGFLLLAVVSAFIGVYLGSRLIRKITLRTLQSVVAFALILFALLLAFGII